MDASKRVLELKLFRAVDEALVGGLEGREIVRAVEQRLDALKFADTPQRDAAAASDENRPCALAVARGEKRPTNFSEYLAARKRFGLPGPEEAA